MASPPPKQLSQQQHTPPASATSSAADLPMSAHLVQWTVDDVCRWALTLPHIAAVAPVLREHAVDGHVLVHYVTNAVLADELGIAAFGTRVHVLEAIEALRWSHGIRARPPPPLRQSSEASHATQRSPSSSPESDRGPSSKELSPDDADADIGSLQNSKRSASRIADAEKKRQKRAALKKNPAMYAEYLQKERERNARRRARLRAERGRSNSSGDARHDDAKPFASAPHSDTKPFGSSAPHAEAKLFGSPGPRADAKLFSSPGPHSEAKPFGSPGLQDPPALDSARPRDHTQPPAPSSSANDFPHATAAPPAYAPYAADPQAKQPVYIRHPLQPPPHNLRRGPDAAPGPAPRSERQDDPAPATPAHAA
ncbi:hypothetical protein GGH12_005468 [Coemansia sp. RSA 1822]|nr:hypothetical protein LPJ76_001506 [Coemansia sp. RSA 638]KAJ2124895.1 hypothetical protein IW147_001281 [Coemansia sp. RSA 720]KAJ2542270.1 hypothetical protein GGF49_002989 [Coemansia sp. RSA 1853]KAJ2559265.1 hypothetical protein GGH12_005468 [Coemansia sp. RSA 1822]